MSKETGVIEEHPVDKKGNVKERVPAASHEASRPAGPFLTARQKHTGPLPLSYGQQRLWFLQQLAPENLAYNMTRSLLIRGPLDIQALTASFNAMLERHSILRTTYLTEAGRPVQVVHEDFDFSLPYVDLRQLPSSERLDAFKTRQRNEAARPFNLSRDFSLRAWLYQLENDSYILVRETHHIASDLWSSEIFDREFAHFYQAFSRGRPTDLPPLPIEYADYAVWQRQQQETEEARRQLDYWRTQLSEPTPLELPLDHPRPPRQTFNGARIERALPQDLVASLRQVGAKERSTLFMVMLAALNILLGRLSGQTDITVGSPIAGRTATDLEPIIGIFLNSIVLRSDLAGDPTFRDLLGQVRRTSLEAFTHQGIPFEKLLEDLQPERDLSRTPYFQVFFNMLNVESRTGDLLPGLETEKIVTRDEHAIFDLTIYIRSVDGELRAAFVYNPDLFSTERMRTMVDQYFSLLAQAASDPGKPISGFLLAPEAHRARLPDPRKPLSEAWEGPIHARLTHWARQTPEAPAVIGGGLELTYGQLESQANRLAGGLMEAGIGKGGTAAIYARRHTSLVIAMLGVLKTGAAYMILDPAYPANRLAAMLDQAGPAAFIPVAEISADMAGILDTRPEMRQIALPADQGDRQVEAPAVAVSANDAAVIGFTSGSAGQQKAVVGRHGPLTHFYPWMQSRFDLHSGDRYSMLSGLAHDPLQRDIFTAIWTGAAICIPDQAVIETPGGLARWIARQGVTFSHMTPAMGQLLTTGGGARELPLRWAFFVGDRLTRSEVENLRALAPNAGVINAYGSTETQRAVSMHIIPAGQPLDKGPEILPLGMGIPDVQLLLLNREGKPCGIGELGEIHIRSPHLAAGYLKDALLTAEKFTGSGPNRMYRTGDLGRYNPDGSVAFAGRADRQVKVRGYRIEPVEIESALAAHPEVREAGVILREDLPGGPGLAAYVAPRVPNNIRSFMSARLPDYMLPAAFIPLAQLPLTPNGKIDTRSLPAYKPEDLAALSENISPQDKYEKGVAEIMEDLFQVADLGRQANFFDLGGHSLLAIRLFSRLESHFGVRLPLSTLFQHPTVAGLGVLLRGDETRQWDTLVPIQPHGSRPPFFCVHGFGGGVVGYAELSRQLGEDQPFYGLQARGLDGTGSPDYEVGVMAGRYIQAMRSVQPEGPYRLGGYCYGGVVAFEMARQLAELGEETELIAIFEGYAPLRSSNREGIWRSSRQIRQYLQNLPFWWRDFVALGLRGMWARGRRVTRMLYRRLLRNLDFEVPVNLHNIIDDDAVHIPETHRRLMEIHVRAMVDYQPGAYSGRIDLFRVPGRSLTRTPDPKNGWENLTDDTVVVHMVEGQHNNILELPHVETLAKALEKVLKSKSP